MPEPRRPAPPTAFHLHDGKNVVGAKSTPKALGPRAGAEQCLGDMPWKGRATAIKPDARYVAKACRKVKGPLARADRAPLDFDLLVPAQDQNREATMTAGFTKLLAAAALAAVLMPSTTRAVELDPKVLAFKLPDQIKWGPASPAGSQQAVLFGDPSKPGLYGVLNKWTKGNHFSKPHFHPNDRFITVISGGSAADRCSIRSTAACRCRRARSSPTTASRCTDRKSTRLNSSHGYISYAVFCL